MGKRGIHRAKKHRIPLRGIKLFEHWMKAVFRFYGSLNDFLPPGRRATGFVYHFLVPGSVKDMIEASGVPHPEVDLIVANGQPVDFSYLVSEGDRIAVYPEFRSISLPSLLRAPLRDSPPRFVLDTHLGRLASHLRMLGLDSLYNNSFADNELAHFSSNEHRILLTRDRGLLKRSPVTYGYCVRETAPRRQLAEVIEKFKLLSCVQPFQRCIQCNTLLQNVEKSSIANRLPERTATQFDQFKKCDGCGRIYWEGSHFQRMKRFISEILREARNSAHDQGIGSGIAGS